MAVLSYVSVTSSAAPISSDSATPPSLPDPRQTKVILPKKKPLKWSTGMAPGDYGGPPVSSKLRKYWGGEEEDPLTSDDYIWNKDFMSRMQKLIQDKPDDSSIQPDPTKDKPSGFLSLNRVMSLNSLEVDFSKELAAPSKSVSEKLAESLPQAEGRTSARWKFVPTRREQDKWDKATAAATGGSDVLLREIRQPKGDLKVLAAEAMEQYYKLKKKMQIQTLGIGGVGLVSAYVSYSPEIAFSFAVGLVGSLVYVRMLGSSIDSMADGAKGLVKGAIAQPRLLVPVVLVMVFNRWNGIAVHQYGVMPLELIPMLVGFFTYKIATFAQAIEEALPKPGKKSQV